MIPELENKDIERTYSGVRPLYAPDESDRSGSDNSVENRLMPEETCDFIQPKFDNNSNCRTHKEELPYMDDIDKLDKLVEQYSAVSPADIDIVSIW